MRWRIIDACRGEDEVWRDVQETVSRHEVFSLCGSSAELRPIVEERP